jgi:predicted metalloendopeptidase
MGIVGAVQAIGSVLGIWTTSAEAPLTEWLASVDRIGSTMDLASFVGKAHAYGMGILCTIAVEPDLKDSTMERLYLGQGGLGMPSRDYYLDEAKLEQREKYAQHVANMLSMAGIAQTSDHAEELAQLVLRVETSFAKIHRTPAAMRDLPKLYNPCTVSQLVQAHASKSHTTFFDSFQRIFIQHLFTRLLRRAQFAVVFALVSRTGV